MTDRSKSTAIRRGSDRVQPAPEGQDRGLEGFRRLGAVLTPPTDPGGRDWIGLTTEQLPTETALAWATTPGCGAVVVFHGVVRDHADGRDGVRGMSYEAYDAPARRAMTEVADAARARWPEIERVALLHRVGELLLSDTSVAVVVSSPHRAAAFEAARFCIDTLKETVPIWKQEHWTGGSDWAVEQHPIRRVESV
jgi:molybdopterin synthase catalytic subunit